MNHPKMIKENCNRRKMRLATFGFSLFLVATLFAGCGDTPPDSSGVTKSDSRQTNEMRSGFTKVNENLFARDLEQVTGDKTRFESLPASETGVSFQNTFQQPKHLKLIETGAGVAIADYDLDGKPDIYLLCTDGPNRLFRQTGELQFEDVTESAGVAGAVNGKDVWGAGASFADVDNDGDLDLYVCNMDARNLLYMNQGDGTFEEQASAYGLDHHSASKIGSFCDYDLDGDLDLYLLTYKSYEPKEEAKVRMVNGEPTVHPDYVNQYMLVDGKLSIAGELDVLYRNNGDGTFSDVTEEAGVSDYGMGLSVTWWDYNNDGLPDIYVGNDFKGADRLYENRGDGTFTDVLPKVVAHTPWFSMGADAGDLNNDGLEDYMIADMSGSTHYKQKTNMGDMGASGWFLSYGNPRQYMRNCVFVNTGAGRFLETAFMFDMDSTDWTWTVRFADLNNDGLSDVFITNGHSRDTGNSDFKNRLNALKDKVSEEELEAVVATAPPLEETNRAYKNLGNLQFTSAEQDWNLDLNGVSHGAAFADLDNDGDLDLVINNFDAPASVYRNDSGEGNRIRVELEGIRNNRFGIGATVEVHHGEHKQMRRLFPVRGYISSDEPVLHFGLGDSSQVEKLVVTWPTGQKQVFENLPAGKRYRIVESSVELASSQEPQNTIRTLFSDATQRAGMSHKHEEIEFNDYRREPLLPYQLSQLGPGISWGDLNGDGLPDAFTGGARFQEGMLFLNEGGKFRSSKAPFVDDVEHEDMAGLFFDANGDGFEDLYVVSGSNECKPGDKILQDRLYINDGKGRLKRDVRALPELFDSGSCVCASDFDRDGDLDLFVGSRGVPGSYPVVPESRLLINENGQFQEATPELAPELKKVGLVNGALWIDYDNDGWTDLLVALDWGPVTVFQNREGTLTNVTNNLGLDGFTGWWHGLAAADFDGDGDLDFVATNQGLNTKYHCNASHPHRLYYSDFDESGTLDLVEAEFEGETEFPVRGRSCSSNCMPFIKDKFETFHEFAMAPLEDIYTSDIKNRPFHEVNELRTMVIWNNGSDGMKMEPLPTLAQISPGYGVVAKDLDNDGHTDILLAQNFYANQPETGYMDGGVGLLLKGTGTRNFVPVWPAESGIVVPEDATSVSVADFDGDGDNDCVFVTNNGPLRLFENKINQPTEKEKFIGTIRIRGPEGNSQAIGARVTLDFGDRKQTHQITAGSSYLGQSSPQISYSVAPKKISVVWPDGKESEYSKISKTDQLELSYPEAE